MPKDLSTKGSQALTNAERQARFRARKAAQAGTTIRHRRLADRRTRLQRWHAADAELLALQAEYTAWADALPDGLRVCRPEPPVPGPRSLCYAMRPITDGGVIYRRARQRHAKHCATSRNEWRALYSARTRRRFGVHRSGEIWVTGEEERSTNPISFKHGHMLIRSASS